MSLVEGDLHYLLRGLRLWRNFVGLPGVGNRCLWSDLLRQSHHGHGDKLLVGKVGIGLARLPDIVTEMPSVDEVIDLILEVIALVGGEGVRLGQTGSEGSGSEHQSIDDGLGRQQREAPGEVAGSQCRAIMGVGALLVKWGGLAALLERLVVGVLLIAPVEGCEG
ncbi:hypothetical protein B296_00038322 [Ensete ventricosum]|uniref:Uncharacterized protein n=1 Tax=Ensete ventricosum TaxID=4639 RepID=A0A426ZGA8_ENSVE|nr:hypothetical protein B296_00038322 [Ensete ventricosum]